jgi:hypothetical protein
MSARPSELEPRIGKNRSRARPGKGIRQPLTRLQVHRITLGNPDAPPAQRLERMLEERRRNTPVPPARLDIEAGQGPDLIRVFAGERPRPLQARKIRARPKSDPADRLLARERDRALRLARLDQPLEPPLRRRTLQVLPALAFFQPPVHAPAAAASPARSEQCFQRRPQRRRQILDDQLGFGHAQPEEMPMVSGTARHSPTAASSDRMRARHAPVAQLDRVPGYEPGGREFESLRARHIF